MEERRIFVRFPAILPLKFSDLNTKKAGEGQNYDISAKGVGFITDEELAPRTLLEIWLYISNKREPVCVKGEVVWSNKIEPDRYRVGVDLEKLGFVGFITR